MTEPATDRHRAAQFYARLVGLYPKAHRDEFGQQMQYTFEDSYRHATQGERRVGVGFWLALLWDEGRSIVRERAADPYGDIVFFALVSIWGLGILIVPAIPAAGEWRNLVLPIGILAVLLLAVPGSSRISGRLATVVVALAVIECVAWAAQAINDQSHLLAPTMLLAGMAFLIKTAQGLNARIIGIKDSVWDRGELLYGALAGLVGIVAMAISVVNTSDSASPAILIVGILVPFICGFAAFKNSTRNRSLRSGTYVALGSMLIGAAIWILAEPLLVEGALLTVFRDHPVPAAQLLPYWGMGPILFWTALNGMVGAFFGVESTRTDEAARESTSQP
jgi:hypothetical protein